MDQIELTTTEREALHSWRFPHPPPRVQRNMEALDLQRQGVASEAIWRLCAMAQPTFSRSLHASRVGGIEALKEVPFPQPQSPVVAYRTRSEADWRPRPPASGAEAAARIAALPGRQRGPPQGRQCLQSLGMKPRTGGQIPAQADVAGQAAFKTTPLAPRLAAAQAGQRVVCFMEAAPLVFAPFVGLGGWCERLVVQAPSGRQRCPVLAALPATTRASCTVTHLTSSTSETVCELLGLLGEAHPGVLSPGGRDHARSQRGVLGQSLAQRLGLEVLFFPAYAPNLPLMERFWQFGKTQWLYSKDYADSLSFQPAISAGIEQAPDKHQEALAR
jgi:hypothetical protein